MRSNEMALALAAAVLAFAGSCVRRDPLPPLSGPLPSAQGPLAFSLPFYPGGERHSIASDRGQVVLLDVWASWCEPCRDALPTSEQLLKQYGPRGFRVYAVNVDNDLRQVPKFLEETKLSLPVLLDTDLAVSGQLKVNVMPTSFLVDRKGYVRHVHEGFAEEFLARYQAEIEQLLAEKAD
ncbi:MAG: TlpA family protein disulfide reductase [Myxococcales bacterium]|nr:TlpA family protein disulfide reductase [Myxococcales bacterium]